MDKYEYKIRSEEIRNLIAEGEYVEAAEIADMIDWRRVKSVMMLCTISDLYKINRRFEDSKELLLLAYDRHPTGRTIVYSLCELSIKMGEFVQAIEYYKQFVQLAPKDVGRYILQYKLYVAQEVSLEERIEVLEELKKKEYREKWMYELAYLYHRIGLATQCVEACDELILMFGEGRYVVKAMELKMLHQPLTADQQKRYDNRFAEYEQVQEEAQSNTAFVADSDNPIDVMGAPTVEISNGEIEDIQVKTMDVGPYNTINLQKELADNMRELQELWGSSEQTPQVSITTEEYFTDDTGRMGVVEESEEIPEEMSMETYIAEPVQEMPEENISEEIIEEKNFQDEISENERIMQAIVSPLFQETEDMTEIAVQMEEPQPVQEIEEEIPEEIPEEISMETEEQIVEEETVEVVPEEPETTVVKKQQEVTDHTAELVLAAMRSEMLEEEAVKEEIPAAEVPKPQIKPTAAEVTDKEEKFAKFLGMEYDGQMSLIVPEAETVEKQITGQLNLEDILAEWEKMKKESERQCAEEVRQLVLQHTGNILVDFDQAAKDGLLEKLEKSEGVEPSKATSVEEKPVQKTEEPIEEAPVEKEVYQEETLVEEVYEEEPSVEEEVYEEEPPVEEEVYEEEPPVEEEVYEEEASAEDARKEELPAEEEIPQEKPPVTETSKPARALTNEEKELFATFIQNKKAKEQLIAAIDAISLAPYTGNVILTGEEGMDTLTLAKNLMKEVQMMDSNFSGKIAKIGGNMLNQRDLNKILGKLNNGALIVEDAGQMTADTAENLHKALQQENRGMIVILEGTKKSIGKLVKAVPRLQDCFNARIDIEALDNDSLVAFGKKYAKEQEYSIDEMGLLALHTKISDCQTSDHAVNLNEVKEMIDEAIYKANRKTVGHFFDILFAKRYDEDDMIILREKDFN